MQTFPLYSLSSEVKTMVFAKVSGDDSLKLLKVAKQPREFVLRHGPYERPFDKVDIKIEPNVVTYKIFFTQPKIHSSKLQLLVFGEVELSDDYEKANQALLLKTFKFIQTTKLLNFDVRLDGNDFDELNILLAKFRSAAACNVIFKNMADLGKLVDVLFLDCPRFQFGVDCSYSLQSTELAVDADRGKLLLAALRRLLLDCDMVLIGTSFHFFSAVLRGTRVKQIHVHAYGETVVSAVIKEIMARRMLTRNRDTTFLLVAGAIDRKWCLARRSLKRVPADKSEYTLYRNTFLEILSAAYSDKKGEFTSRSISIYEDYCHPSFVIFLDTANQKYFGARYF